MIDAELAAEVQPLLSVAIACLVEDEHMAMVTPPPKGELEAHAERLRELGMDIAIIARALAVILRRARPAPAQQSKETL